MTWHQFPSPRAHHPLLYPVSLCNLVYPCLASVCCFDIYLAVHVSLQLVRKLPLYPSPMQLWTELQQFLNTLHIPVRLLPPISEVFICVLSPAFTAVRPHLGLHYADDAAADRTGDVRERCRISSLLERGTYSIAVIKYIWHSEMIDVNSFILCQDIIIVECFGTGRWDISVCDWWFQRTHAVSLGLEQKQQNCWSKGMYMPSQHPHHIHSVFHIKCSHDHLSVIFKECAKHSLSFYVNTFYFNLVSHQYFKFTLSEECLFLCNIILSFVWQLFF